MWNVVKRGKKKLARIISENCLKGRFNLFPGPDWQKLERCDTKICLRGRQLTETEHLIWNGEKRLKQRTKPSVKFFFK